MIRYYRELTRLEMEQTDRERTIVLIPLGALEQHGNQAPLGTDGLIADVMPRYLKEEIEKVDPDFPMLIFPTIPVGLSMEHLNFCGSISFKPDTYYHMLYDIGESLARHGFQKLAFLVCHGGNAPTAQILSRQLRCDFGILPFVLSCGAFGHPDVKATVSPGNVWDFHGGEMETSMVLAIDPSLVKLDTAEAGIPTAFVGNKSLMPYGSVALNWMGEDWRTADGRPIGIGGDPSGATAEKGEVILRTSARELVQGLLEIRDFKLPGDNSSVK